MHGIESANQCFIDVMNAYIKCADRFRFVISIIIWIFVRMGLKAIGVSL